MRCPQCNKFVGTEMADPEISSEGITDGSVTGEVRMVQTCAECGEEMAESNQEFEIPFEIEHTQKDCAEDDLGLEVEAENDDRYEGKGRGMRHFYVAAIRAKVTCGKCKAEVEVEGSVEEQASSFDPLF